MSERYTDTQRFRQELDNHITGYYGEDEFRDEQQPEDFTFQFPVTMTRKNADTLLEFLSTMLNELMHLETVVHYTKDDEATDE